MIEPTTIIDHLLYSPFVNDAFSIAFFVMSILLAFVWRNFLIVFVHKTREMVLVHDWRTFEAENANSGVRLRLLLMTINLSSVSIFLYQVVEHSTSLELSYWYILVALFAIHFIRIVVTKLLEIVFNLQGSYEIWVESYTWIHYIFGVIFFPLAVLMTYSPEMTFSICANLALVFFVLGEMLLFYRLFSVFYSGMASLFYLFLYLCTLEIIPLLTMFRILS